MWLSLDDFRPSRSAYKNGFTSVIAAKSNILKALVTRGIASRIAAEFFTWPTSWYYAKYKSIKTESGPFRYYNLQW